MTSAISSTAPPATPLQLYTPTGPALFLPLPAAPRRLALFCQWAADVRDRRGVHAELPEEVARQAGLLAALIGQWQQRQTEGPTEAFSPVEGSVEALVGWLVLRGVRPPA